MARTFLGMAVLAWTALPGCAKLRGSSQGFMGRQRLLQSNTTGKVWVDVGQLETDLASMGQQTPSYTYPNYYQWLALDAQSRPYVCVISRSSQGFDATAVVRYNGSSWEAVGNLDFSWNNGMTSPTLCSVSIDPSTDKPFVSAEAYDRSSKQILTLKNDTNGSWDSLGKLSNGNLSYVFSGVAFASSTPYTLKDSNKLVRYEAANGNWSQVGGGPFVQDHQWSKADFALSKSGTPFVAFSSYPALDLTVKSLQNGTWVVVGQKNIAGTTNYGHFKIAVDPRTEYPMVAFEECFATLGSMQIACDSTGPSGSFMYLQRITVMAFNGSAWESLGGHGAAGDYGARGPRLAVTSEGVPMVAYHNGTENAEFPSGYQGHVKMWQNGSWVFAGPAVDLGPAIWYSTGSRSLALGPNGEAYAQRYSNETQTFTVAKLV